MLEAGGGSAGLNPGGATITASRAGPFGLGEKKRRNICGVTTLLVSTIGPIKGPTALVGAAFDGSKTTTGGFDMRFCFAGLGSGSTIGIVTGSEWEAESSVVTTGDTGKAGNVTGTTDFRAGANCNPTGPTFGR